MKESPNVDLEAIRLFLNKNDRFCKENGIQITLLKKGYAEARLDVEPKHLNGVGIIQGGAIYTLCDLAFAGAVNSYGFQAVGLNSSINYLRPGKGQFLKAVAREVKQGRNTAVYQVDVYDENEKLIANASLSAFVSNELFEKQFAQ